MSLMVVNDNVIKDIAQAIRESKNMPDRFMYPYEMAEIIKGKGGNSGAAADLTSTDYGVWSYENSSSHTQTVNVPISFDKVVFMMFTPDQGSSNATTRPLSYGANVSIYSPALTSWKVESETREFYAAIGTNSYVYSSSCYHGLTTPNKITKYSGSSNHNWVGIQRAVDNQSFTLSSWYTNTEPANQATSSGLSSGYALCKYGSVIVIYEQ